MAGDAILFARQDYVEEAWRIVDPALKANTSDFMNTTKVRGVRMKPTKEFSPPGGWHNPIATDVEDYRVAAQKPPEGRATAGQW